MSAMLVVFEDSGWRNLRPLTDWTPVPALRFGASDLATRWARATELPMLAVVARPIAAEFEAAAKHPPEGDEILVANAAALPGPWIGKVLGTTAPCLFRVANRIVAARLPFDTVVPGLDRGERFEAFLAGIGLPEQSIDAPMITYPWDLIALNGEAIRSDLARMKGTVRGEVHPQAVILEPSRVTIEEGARIEALAVLDARGGPIWIGRGALVSHHTVVTGPCVVGARTQLLGGSIGHSSVGPECRVAGEVEDSIWQGYGNKRHHGFVGHSVIGEWVNLGALTTTSDLKNNYGPVRVWIEGREIDSGSTKVGSLIGAHVKTGIGTLLPTGCVVGTGSNLFGGGKFAPKQVPSFAWWDGTTFQEHRIEPFLKTARIAMGRRDRTLEAELEAHLEQLFTATAGERANIGASR